MQPPVRLVQQRDGPPRNAILIYRGCTRPPFRMAKLRYACLDTGRAFAFNRNGCAIRLHKDDPAKADDYLSIQRSSMLLSILLVSSPEWSCIQRIKFMICLSSSWDYVSNGSRYETQVHDFYMIRATNRCIFMIIILVSPLQLIMVLL